jgi:hypothetical protein
MKINYIEIISKVKSSNSISELDKIDICNSLDLLKHPTPNNVFIVIKEISELENMFNSKQIKEVIKLIEQSLS